MTKHFERFGYTAVIEGNKAGCALLTVKNPVGIIVKQTEYKNWTSALGGWYGWCNRRGMKIRPHDQDTIVIDVNIPDSEESVQSIEKPIPTNKQKIANNLPITAIIDFNFVNELNLSLSDWINAINERIKSGEYRPSEIVRIRLVPNN